MGKLAVETRSAEPKNFFAGDFPTVPESGTAGADIKQYTPVTTDEDGKIVPIAPASGEGDTETAATTAAVIGIAAEEAKQDEPVVYYMTGEFFADAINLPAGIELADVKTACWKISIFLK